MHMNKWHEAIRLRFCRHGENLHVTVATCSTGFMSFCSHGSYHHTSRRCRCVPTTTDGMTSTMISRVMVYSSRLRLIIFRTTYWRRLHDQVADA